MSHYILDARVATPHFPGIGRYVTNLAAALIPLLAHDERLTLLYDPAHPLPFLNAERPSMPPSAPREMQACHVPGTSEVPGTWQACIPRGADGGMDSRPAFRNGSGCAGS
ncbi:MAG: hypothetical protein N2378_15935 [Chloroflexaceae bacterium]|nr:hypothetical protein [Chloroflexaceae bacterium]